MDNKNRLKTFRLRCLFPKDADFDKFFQNGWGKYCYDNSETITDSDGNLIEGGIGKLAYFFNHGDKPFSFRADCKVSSGLKFNQTHYIEDLLHKLKPLYKEHKFNLSLNDSMLCEAYINFLEKLKNELQPNPNFHPNGVNETDIKPRVINSDELKSYFKPTFKGMGNGNINYFDVLIEELKNNRSNKEFAQIACIIHKSDKTNDRKPKQFSKWYKIFCECVGCDVKKYCPKDLKPSNNIQKLFNYI